MKSPKKNTKAKIVKNDNNPVSLSSADICKIIKQCRSNGVLSLSIEGLDIKLSEAVKKPIPIPRPVAPVDPKLPEAAVKKDPFDEDDLLEHEAAELMISDPEAYEALMIGPDVR